IRNPIVPIVVFTGLMLMGLLAFSRMHVQQEPDIELPLVVVNITQPGAAPTEVENQITQRVEASLRSINGVSSISSTASEGSSRTMVEFELGVDIIEGLNDVKNAVDQVRGELPDGILEPNVFKVNNSSNPIAYFAVEADDMTLEQLSWFIDDTVAKRLLSVEGVAEVSRIGGVDREILVTLDPARMQSLGVTASQVNQSLRALNVNAAGGRAEIGGVRQSVRVLGNAKDAYALSQTDAPIGNGRTIKLADIATVKDAFGEVSSKAKFNGKPVVTFSIARARGASDVTAFDGSVEQIHGLEKEYPGTHFVKLFSSVDYTKAQYESSMAAMVEGAILAVIVVFFFLRDWRATVIAAIAIPLSAIPTFWVIESWFGFTLNQLSLLALGLVAGVLVDDAIVEIENIVRHMRMGKSAYQASIDAADEIGLAVVATTFSIVAVFLPVGLMPGISGEFFRNFGLTVVVSVLMSLAVARMITPMVAAYFLKAHGHAEHAGGPWMDRYLAVLHWSLENRKAKAMRARIADVAPSGLIRAFPWVIAVGAMTFMGARMLNGESPPNPVVVIVASLFVLFIAYFVAYLLMVLAGLVVGIVSGGSDSGFVGWSRFIGKRIRARLSDHRIWMMFVGAGSLGLTGVLFATLPMSFFPTQDNDFSSVSVEMVPGTTIQQTEAVVDRVAKLIRAQPETAGALERIYEGNGRVMIMLRKDRARTSQEFEQDLTKEYQKIPDARVTVQDMTGGGSGTGRAISVMLSGSDPVLLDKTAAKLVEEMKGLKQVVAPRIAADMRRPELVIKPRLDLASQLGVSTAALSQTIRIATMGDIDQNAAKFSLSDRQVPIRVRMPETARRDLANIRNMPVPTTSGGSVPLARVAEITFGSGPTSIQRYNQERRTFIGADLAPGIVKSEADEAIQALPLMKDLPRGISNKAYGADRWQQEMLDSLAVALPAGIQLVFSVLVLLYHRVISPLVNMSSLFLAPLGGLIALVITGQSLSMPVF
ncbi:MAG: efflux RND transporter permease subunit, partial [Planctomycetales bacterium]|nr:efflux RND transporter permease subunit [Planctomycetales bacterium]